MFGCSEHWLGKRFSHAFTESRSGPRARRELSAHDAVEADALAQRYEAWRGNRHAGVPPPDATSGSPCSGDADVPWGSTAPPVPPGKTHVVPSDERTVELGLFDPAREPVAVIDSGDVVVYPNTWTHFLNALQPGMSIDELAALRARHPGRGVHSIIGPVAVRGARPGDMLQLRMLRLRTIGFGANFHNPRAIGTGVLPGEFEHGHIKYFDLHADDGFVAFDERIRLAMKPFQGTLGVAAPGPGAISSVAPGRYAGNIDVKELTVGSSLFVPVFHEGGLIFTGDSHALQGDGEVNITALETAMEDCAIQVIVHQNAGWEWPFVETPTHWIPLGMDADLDEALRIALRNTIGFLHRKAGLTRDDAYSLASLAVDFRVSQMVDVNNGVHAMIPKEIFAADYCKTIAIV